MIDDATIKWVAKDSGATIGMKLDGIQYVVPKTANFTIDQLHKFARAIDQLARQEQREEDARICEYEQVDAIATGEPTDAAYNMALAHAAKAIRTAGKENKID